jgi:RNA-binding protein 26
MYEHGQDSIFVPPGKQSEEYDPSNSSIVAFDGGNGAASTPGHFRGGDRGRGRGGFRGDRGHNPSRRGGRAEFSSDKPNFDKSKTTIVVENIPEEKFSEDEVRGFFSDFGEILEVSMRPYKRLATIKFSDWNAAKAAYSSPKVIFDNRFVKVYWYTDQESLPQPPSVATSRPANGSANANGGHGQGPARAASEPKIDIEEFARKQQEVQKAHEEKTKKKQEMEAARKELEKRQEDLLKSQAEEKRKLMEKIAAKSGKATTEDTENPTETKAAAQTDVLRAQLAALEAEAQSLGIDPAAAVDDSWSSRGRGRGRGGYRGRGAFVPRGFRGGYRGRGGAAAFGGSAYKLDNRPKTVGISGIDFTDSEKDESLRQYLLVSLYYSFTLLSICPGPSLPSLPSLNPQVVQRH